jgi:hypothetical protein
MVLIEVLQLPWTLIELSDSEVMWRSKSRAVGLAVKLGWKSQVLTFDKIVEQALKDEDASLRSYAILVIPLLVLQSSSARLQTFCEVILYVKFVKAASTYAIDLPPPSAVKLVSIWCLLELCYCELFQFFFL